MALLHIDRPADGVARLTLDRPDKRNALSTALRDEISDALDELTGDESLKVLVITGAGTTFSAGFDLKELTRSLEDEELARELWGSSDRYHRTVLQFPLPAIASVNGPALAGGFDLAVMCDVRIASTAARFAHPEFSFGDVVYGPLHDLVGGAIARDLVLTGRELSAEEALDLHVVTRLVAPDELDAATLALAVQVTQAPRDVLLRSKAKAVARSGVLGTTGTLDL
jgi:enoyl-CoA hydratase